MQLTVQRALQHRRKAAACRLPDTDGLGFQHRCGQVLAKVGGVLEQRRLKRRHRVADRAHAPAAGFHPVRQIHQLCHYGVIQQRPEDHKPMQMGIPFSQFHFISLLF